MTRSGRLANDLIDPTLGERLFDYLSSDAAWSSLHFFVRRRFLAYSPAAHHRP
jgi:hypothetical protein